MTLSLRDEGLNPDIPHIYCVTLLHHGHVVPGCSGPITASEAREDHVPRVRITGLHGNVSVTHNMTVHVTARVPGNKLTSSEVRLSVSVPGQPPVREDSYKCEAGADEGHEAGYCDIEAMVSDLPPHSYYNVCAELSGDTGPEVLDSQCMILHTSTIVRYETRSEEAKFNAGHSSFIHHKFEFMDLFYNLNSLFIFSGQFCLFFSL